MGSHTCLYQERNGHSEKIHGRDDLPGWEWLQSGSERHQARKTVVIDFKKIRDDQTPDGLGNIIPLDLDHAQLAFSGFGPDAKILSGRAEQMSTAGGIASTYACVNCCGDSPNDAWITPYGEEIGVGGTLGFTAVQEMRNCAYQVTGTFPIFADYWLTADSSIATVDSFGGAEGIAPGDTLITAGWNMGYWLADNGVCVHQNAYSEPTSPVEVKCAQPTNFRRYGDGEDVGGGTLRFYYTWDSNTGKRSDLSACQITEVVDHPGAGPSFTPPAPFPNESFSDPYEREPFYASDGEGAVDNHSVGSPFRTPYSAATYTSVQQYKYRCPCKNNNSWVNFGSTIDIVRSVISVGGGTWKYRVAKSGFSAEINPLP